MADEKIDLDRDFKDSIASLSLDELTARLESLNAAGLSKTGERHAAIIRSRIEQLQVKPHTTRADLEAINQLHQTPVRPRTNPEMVAQALKEKDEVHLDFNAPTVDLDKEFKESIAELSLQELQARIEAMEKEGTSKTGQRHLAIMREKLNEMNNPLQNPNTVENKEKTHGFNAEEFAGMYMDSQLRSGKMRPKDIIHYINTLDENGRKQYAAYQQTLASHDPLRWVNPGGIEHEGEWSRVNEALAIDQMARVAAMGGKSADNAKPYNLENQPVSNLNRRPRVRTEQVDVPLFVQNAARAASYADEKAPHGLDIEKIQFLIMDSMSKSGSSTPEHLDKYLSGLSEKGRRQLEEYKKKLEKDPRSTLLNALNASEKRRKSGYQEPVAQPHIELQNINRENAITIFNNGVKEMPPTYLWQLRQSLAAREGDQEALSSNIELENIIVDKSAQLADKKIALFDIDQTYALNEMLDNIKVNPLSPQTAARTETIDAALKITSEEITNFENQYGIAEGLLQSPSIVEENIVQLAEMPSNSELFSLDIKPEKLAAPSNLQSVKQLLNVLGDDEKAPSISILAGALQCSEIDNAQKEKLLHLTLLRVKETDKLSQSEFKNFEFLLDSLQTSKESGAYSTASRQKAMLGKARETYLKSSPLKEKQFQDIYNILSNMQVKGDLTLMGRKTVSQKGQNSDISLFMEQVRNETEIFMANTSAQGITQKAFKEEYAERLKNNIVQLVYADKLSKGEITAKDFGNAFDTLAQSAQSAKPIIVNETSCIGYQAAKTNRSTSAASRLGEKKGYENPAKSFLAKIKATDQKLEQKYGKGYSLLRGGLRSAGWGVAYSLGAAFGPAGMAAVATASFANQAYGIYKDYKKQKAENPNTSFWSYLKQNKMRLAGALMGAAAVTISAGGLGANSAIRVARAGSGVALAAAGALHQAAQAYKAQKGNRWKKLWAATKAFGTSAIGFGIGMAAGRMAGEAVNAGADYFRDNDTTLMTNTAATLNNLDANSINPNDPLGMNAQMQEWNRMSEFQTITPEINEAPSVNPEPVYKPEINEAPSVNPEPVYKPEENANVVPQQETIVHHESLQSIVNQDEVNAQLNGGIKPVEFDSDVIDRPDPNAPEIEVNKIKIDHDFKIVGHQDGGRVVLHLDNTDISDIDKIKFHDDGSVSVRMDNETGETVKFRIGEDGKYDLYREGGHTYTQEELEVLNSNPEVIAQNQQNFSQLQELRETSAEHLRAEAAQQATTQEAEAPAPAEAAAQPAAPQTETPAQETQTPAPAEAAPQTPTQEAAANTAQTGAAEQPAASQTGAPAQETAANTTQAEAAAQTPSQEAETSAPAETTPPTPEPVVHTTTSGARYSFDEDGRMAIQGTPGDIDHLKPDTVLRDAQGVYHMGEAASTELSMLHKIENQNLRTIAINDQVYSDLQARAESGETLGDAENRFMQNHEQRLANNNLTHDEDGSLRRLTKDEIIAQKRGVESKQSASHNSSGVHRVLIKDSQLPSPHKGR